MTGSIQRAIAETNRRREMQIAFNEANGITPKGIEKAVADVMEAGSSQRGGRRGRRQQTSAPATSIAELSVADATKRMKQLEKEMYDAARNLEFERAAQLRDELELLRANIFKGEPTSSAGQASKTARDAVAGSVN